ncbi:imidazole glycerol phosphate synthase subunit HisH [Methanococcus voltae]|uniref:Imidazole glycerol phosphate synthase subunit HisH n=1 Tax=Methanococcus voltae (strain ATCC BAA-1334 / A3) TaxID=456320 RepID=D7DRY5_METV3|nr:imidazole glycerol phosphate synthase subunit HisH [Methanococcus voltae]MCS3901420.1 glutamine amidotransferase [Methanococcus voltae]
MTEISQTAESEKDITIVNYGLGNLKSVANIIKKMGGNPTISSSKEDIKNAKKLILPGVGAFDEGMNNLEKMDLINILDEKVLDEKVLTLGICLGMQLITKRSDEGQKEGLGWIDAETVSFSKAFNDNNTNNTNNTNNNNNNKNLKVPHMGWNYVNVEKETPLYNNMYENPRFYFVHSYYVKCNIKEDILTTTSYGIDFTSSINKNNLYATQFHPEKSHKFGMRLMENFINL